MDISTFAPTAYLLFLAGSVLVAAIALYLARNPDAPSKIKAWFGQHPRAYGQADRLEQWLAKRKRLRNL